MTYEYLKSDEKRVEKKLEELNLKYLDMEHKKEFEQIEEKCKALNSKTNPNYRDKIWAQIYKDVLELEKKALK
jgi:hypothetical protein